MKLRKKIVTIVEWVVAVTLLSICIYYYAFSYGSYTALGAYRASEKTYHYGPSKIEKVISLGNGKIYLGKYKNWISATPVEKKLIKWYPGNGVGGFPINYSDKITHFEQCGAMSQASYVYTIFGYVNASSISTINLQFQQNGKIRNTIYKITDNKMFIFCLDNYKFTDKLISLSGLDKNGKVVYEYKYVHA